MGLITKTESLLQLKKCFPIAAERKNFIYKFMDWGIPEVENQMARYFPNIKIPLRFTYWFICITQNIDSSNQFREVRDVFVDIVSGWSAKFNFATSSVSVTVDDGFSNRS